MIVRSIKCKSIKRSACLMARLDSEDGCISVRKLLDTDSPVGFITSPQGCCVFARVYLLDDLLVCQQDHTKTTEWIYT